MAQRDRPHLVVPIPPNTEPFTLAAAGGGSDDGEPRFTGDRRVHGARLSEEYETATAPQSAESEREGAYVSFVSFAGLELAFESLDVNRAGDQPELVAVQAMETVSGPVQIATVYIPDGKKGYLLDKLKHYVESAGEDRARNATLVEGIAAIRRATIREIWTDPPEEFPADLDERRWWEVWLRRRDGRERNRFSEYVDTHDLRMSPHYLGFGDRTIVLLRASARQLAETFDALDDLAELRRPHEVGALVSGLPASEQSEWVDELRNRLHTAAADAPVVCILDTGVQDGHPLLVGSLHIDDIHTADPDWAAGPTHSHGTEMAGLALFGDLHAALVDGQPVRLRHRLESVKLLPDGGENDRDLHGAITARSVDRPEIQSPDRPRIFMLAVSAPNTAPDRAAKSSESLPEAGRPTSWSATVDALAFGRAIDDTDPKFTYLDRDEPRRPRLFVVSAGNISIQDLNPAEDHLDRSDLEPVEDPGQSWNALTVGAYAARDDMSDAPSEFAGYVPVAPRGELSPVSRTSVMYESTKWPFKPDVVADGGNVATSPDRTSIDTPENLALLTTRQRQAGGGFFTTARDTSAATAQVAAMAADICADYPDLRPETVRALVVHSAQWTEPMLDRLEADTNKATRAKLLRRYGMGVPDRTRALRSAADALTLISEARIKPYERDGNSSAGKTREMNVHALPWPIRELEDLGETHVRMRVTLSYFVEPNPSSRGWSGRYIYPSHGLRFATRRPEESVESFRKRINTRARQDGQRPPSLDTELGWFFGANQQQKPGSLHTDIWEGSGADLASKGALAVYPVAGWWKTRPISDQSDLGVDYSLVVSIESPDVEVDLWTPVAQLLSTAVTIDT